MNHAQVAPDIQVGPTQRGEHECARVPLQNTVIDAFEGPAERRISQHPLQKKTDGTLHGFRARGNIRVGGNVRVGDDNVPDWL